MTLLLTAQDLNGLVPTETLIEAVREVHRDLAVGRAVQPVPHTVTNPGASSVVLPMGASSARYGLSVVKVLADVPDNSQRQLPTQRSIIAVIDSNTGECVAIIDGEVPTRERTAATTAVATDLLANPDSGILGLVGAGKLAIQHVKALETVRPIRRIHVWSRSPSTLEAFESAVHGLEIRVEPSPEAVVRSAEIVCTLTPSKSPVVLGAWLRTGQHVNAVGAPPRHDHREIDGAAFRSSRVFVDSTAIQLADSGDALLAIADGDATAATFDREIGSVLAGQRSGRKSADEITLFNSVGLAVQDLAYVAVCLPLARKYGRGRELDLKRTSPKH